ncbi:MAG: DUF1351 domain-containing protein [Clostridia bacterium]|nr:DUF1351 domain-containing protein [Clostridia bacterium]
MALELKLSEIKVAPVQFNYEELKKEVAERTKPYKGLIVEEDSIPMAKTDLANLRKLEKAIDDRRKAVKKEYNAPYMEFEAKIKDILSDIQEAEMNIDSQVKAFEKRVEDEKRKKIETFYALAFGELTRDVDFETIYNPKWLNKGYKMSDIEEEIAALANDLRDNIETIKGLKTSHEASLLNMLFHTLNIVEVMKQHNVLTAYEERAKAEQARLEAEKAKAEADDKAWREEEQKLAEETAKEEFVVDTPEPLQIIKFWVEVNEEQKFALGSFLRENGIRYGSVK